ncbi:MULTISPECIES: DUF2180 family protein [unclassified Isoptericola]|uniref:DUF2180 family protein n=1 Tax=unclassified Isoptericola TaxID=2623355 RepID=UPI0027134758|nr:MULTISPECIES: DUF2180 family protein [unclassified Isoptericola]MDO8143830.1 DUF2180 family protein [Isoptericola sp. 178]MDO8149973.1 DUF2180 family protein [Isoptericola sp. b408]
MNCFECATEHQATTPAVTVCSQCGAGSCIKHTRAAHAHKEVYYSPGAPGERDLGRRMFCTTCAPDFAHTIDVA